MFTFENMLHCLYDAIVKCVYASKLSLLYEWHECILARTCMYAFIVCVYVCMYMFCVCLCLCVCMVCVCVCVCVYASDEKLVLTDHLITVLDVGFSIRVYCVEVFCLMFLEILLVCTCPSWHDWQEPKHALELNNYNS